MYTIGEFLGDLNESIVWYRIPVSNVNAAATEDLLYRHIISEFSDLALLCDGFNVEKTDDAYYLGVIVDFNDDEIDIDEENFLFEKLPMTEFNRVFGLDAITIPKQFTDEVSCQINGCNYESVEVEFKYDHIDAKNPVMLDYIKFE